ncbi:MAG: hypothetical protein FWH43_03470 [Endomicrobia bacterium]|nr:hypothetical protein [Endomicrobiia bacterium]
MKKIIFAVLGLFFTFTYVQASVLEGFGISAGVGILAASDNYGDVMSKYKKSSGWYGGSSTDNSGSTPQYGFEVFYERKGLFNLKQNHMFGVKAGYMMYNDSDFMQEVREHDYSLPIPPEIRSESIYLTSEAYSIPIGVYYTYLAGTKWKFSLGAGIVFLSNKFTGGTTVKVWDTSKGEHTSVHNMPSDPKTTSLVMPAINIGFEFLIWKYIGLYTDYGMNFNGKTTVGDIERDYSGFNFKFGVKIYVP